MNSRNGAFTKEHRCWCSGDQYDAYGFSLGSYFSYREWEIYRYSIERRKGSKVLVRGYQSSL